MLINVHYKIEYEYTEPVFLEPNEIKIFPRNDLTQKLLDFNIKISPTPSNKTFFIDTENNTGMKVWFNGLTERFSVDFNCRVETYRENPYDFIVDSGKTSLPYKRKKSSSINPAVKNFSDEVKNSEDGDVLRFLTVLSEKINGSFKYEIRETGPAKKPWETLEDKKGACRDFAVLFMESCKHQGLESRFVSGYFTDDDIQDTAHLHAWAEVYIPGGGWRGYDPVNGIAAADRHIPVAASYDPLKVIPVTGNYRSNTSKSKMGYSIKVKKVSIPGMKTKNKQMKKNSYAHGFLEKHY